MALAVARALHAQSLTFPSSPSLLSHPPSRALRTPHAPSPSFPKPATSVVGFRRHVVARAAVSDFGPSIGDILGDVSIFTAAGEPVLFKDLWDQNEGIAVVALLRHFGCFCCWELASSIKEAKERFDSAGVKLVAVGVGTPDKARILADRLPFPMDCLYADPDRKAYDVLGLYYGLGRTLFNPASGKVFSRFEAIQKAMENYTIKATPDDLSSVLQQGGMFVFKGKQLLYARKDEATGDHAPLDDIFNACCKLTAHCSPQNPVLESHRKPMALASVRALHAPPFSFSSPPSLRSQPPSLALPTPHAPALSAPKLATRVVGLRRRVVARAAVSDFGQRIGDILGDVSIFTAAGEPVLFKDLWDQNEGIAVVALLRHFGCPCCWELASALKEAKERFDSAGAKLVAVGVGTPDKARILADRLPFPMDCLYADPDRKAYDVLGLYYGFGRTFFNPASAKVFSRFEALQKALKNYTIEATPDKQSSVLQQGGMFVFKGKQLLYARKDEGTGDHAPLDDIFNVCCKVPVS